MLSHCYCMLACLLPLCTDCILFISVFSGSSTEPDVQERDPPLSPLTSSVALVTRLSFLSLSFPIGITVLTYPGCLWRFGEVMQVWYLMLTRCGGQVLGKGHPLCSFSTQSVQMELISSSRDNAVTPAALARVLNYPGHRDWFKVDMWPGCANPCVLWEFG